MIVNDLKRASIILAMIGLNAVSAVSEIALPHGALQFIVVPILQHFSTTTVAIWQIRLSRQLLIAWIANTLYCDNRTVLFFSVLGINANIRMEEIIKMWHKHLMSTTSYMTLLWYKIELNEILGHP